MTLTRDLLVYIKIPFLIVLVAAFYWRDFLGFWQTVLFSGWLILTSIIWFLVFVFLFQRRKALKTLVSISENHNGQGAGFVLLALVLYVAGSYTPYALWLHWCSLVLFSVGYLALVIDFRIPRILFLPFVALLFVIPPIGTEVFLVQNLPLLVILYLSADVVIVTLVASIVNALLGGKFKARGFFKQTPTRKNKAKSASCPVCESAVFREEVFCFHCGRQQSPIKLMPFKFAFLKFSVLLLIILVLSFVYLPTFSLADREASQISYTAHGIEEQTIIPTLEGWKLESSERMVDYEREYSEDFAVTATYISEEFPENKTYIQLEIGSEKLYMRNGWQPSGWQLDRQEIPLTENVRGRYVVLKKGDNSTTVLYWTMKAIFRVGLVFSPRNVGVSVFSNFTEPMGESKVVEVLTEFRSVAISIINWLDSVSHWTLNFYTLNEIYTRFRDIFFTAVGVVTVMGFAGWIKAKDEKVDKLAESAYILMEDEAMLLIAIWRMKPKRFLGKELFDAYRRVARSEMDLKEFYEKLRRFLMHGLIGKDYILQNGELVMAWKRMFF